MALVDKPARLSVNVVDEFTHECIMIRIARKLPLAKELADLEFTGPPVNEP